MPDAPSDNAASSVALRAIVEDAVSEALKKVAEEGNHACLLGLDEDGLKVVQDIAKRFDAESVSALDELSKIPGDLTPGRDVRKGADTMRKNHFAIHGARKRAGATWTTFVKVITIGGLGWLGHWLLVGFKESLKGGG